LNPITGRLLLPLLIVLVTLLLSGCDPFATRQSNETNNVDSSSVMGRDYDADEDDETTTISKGSNLQPLLEAYNAGDAHAMHQGMKV